MPPIRLRTAAFEAYVAPARRAAELWRILPGLYVILLVQFVWFGLLLSLLVLWFGGGAMAARLRDLVAPTEPGATLLLLSTFVGLAAGAFAAVAFVHGRAPGTLIGPARVARRDFLRAVLVVAGVYVVMSLPWVVTWDGVPNLEFGTWALLLPLSLAGVLVQTLSEELVFRGYLMQQLAARFRSPMIWLLLPALGFGIVHYNPETNGANTWAVIAVVTCVGLVAGDLTRRTGSLGAAWGLHFANNVLALLILGQKGSIEGLALWVTPYSAADTTIAVMLLGDAVAIAVVWAILVRVLRR